MPRILVVADDPWVRNEVHAALSLPGVELVDHDDPTNAAERAATLGVDAAVVDLQIRSMGGMAVTRDFRDLEATNGSIPVVLLLDRHADAFLARRAGAAAWASKPIEAHELRRALASIGVTVP
ncbi:MAG TPA: response regulator transcription factor [Actinobacteria bacterium]|nr:response regulator transcription factor [Actinomycetota bacterium]